MKIKQILKIDGFLFVLTEEGELWILDVGTMSWSMFSGHEDDKGLKASNEQSIDDLELSTRIKNALKRQGINTLNELLSLTSEDIKNLPGIGEKSQFELVSFHHDLERGYT